MNSAADLQAAIEDRHKDARKALAAVVAAIGAPPRGETPIVPEPPQERSYSVLVALARRTQHYKVAAQLQGLWFWPLPSLDERADQSPYERGYNHGIADGRLFGVWIGVTIGAGAVVGLVAAFRYFYPL